MTNAFHMRTNIVFEIAVLGISFLGKGWILKYHFFKNSLLVLYKNSSIIKLVTSKHFFHASVKVFPVSIAELGLPVFSGEIA